MLKHVVRAGRRAAASSPAWRRREIRSAAPMERVDCVVIGAGVVGLAVAREIARRGREVLVVDSAPTFGTATSSRNSEVIHAGIYYPRNSLKVWVFREATIRHALSFNREMRKKKSLMTSNNFFGGSTKAMFCATGRDLLYKYCSEHNIPHKQIGKLIVATSTSEISKLNDIMSRGTQNGVPGLRMMEGSEAMRMEPELQCVKAILSPLTGILDTHSFMLSLVGEAEDNGATFSYNTTVFGGHIEENRVSLHISETKSLEDMDGNFPPQPELVLVPNLVVNSAGLSAPLLAKRFSGLQSSVIPATYYARGCYFTLSNAKLSPFKQLIYPIPVEGGIGVHVTLDLDGQVKFGPDVEWIDGVDEISSFLNKFDYSVHANRAELFYADIRKYYPNLKGDSLQPGYAGIRPKISGPGQPPVDFVIQSKETHGVTGLVNLMGIESPGLTSSLAIAEHIAARFL